MNFAGWILKKMGWTVTVTAPAYDKCIICVAPHTSNWDFLMGKLTYASVNRQSGFLMKSTWFFFPLGLIFKAMGGVPVYRNRKGNHGSLVDQLVEKFNTEPRLTIAITPEGTRSRTTRWKTGFLTIAYRANVPIILGVLDYKKKSIDVSTVFEPTGDVNEDMKKIKEFYRGSTGKYPDKFSTDDE